MRKREEGRPIINLLEVSRLFNIIETAYMSKQIIVPCDIMLFIC